VKRKKVIGLTGKYCAGKNHIASLLEQRHIPVLDVDKLGHQVIENEKERIVAHFGNDILNSDGYSDDYIDRKRLGNKVFGKQKEMEALEEIIHPAANRETLAWINARLETACVINAALLHRSSAFEMLDAVIIVEAPFFVRLLRARKRDRLPWVALLKRFRSQRKFSAQFFKGTTDIYRVKNSVCFSFFSFTHDSAEKKLNKRVNEILSIEKITWE
jgi:dephospho-CoA kinase